MASDLSDDGLDQEEEEKSMSLKSAVSLTNDDTSVNELKNKAQSVVITRTLPPMQIYGKELPTTLKIRRNSLWKNIDDRSSSEKKKVKSAVTIKTDKSADFDQHFADKVDL